MKIYVGGINGVGKSSLAKEAAKQLDYQYIHAASGLLDSFGFGKDYEKLRALTQQERDLKYNQYVEDLVREKDNFLLDAHYLNLVRGKIDRVTDVWLNNFDLFVLVSAPIDDIWKRLEADLKFRDRALFPAELSKSEMKNELAKYERQTKGEFERLAKLYQKPQVEILNEENKLEESVKKLISFINHEF